MNANGKDIAEWRPKLLRSAVSSSFFLCLLLKSKGRGEMS